MLFTKTAGSFNFQKCKYKWLFILLHVASKNSIPSPSLFIFRFSYPEGLIVSDTVKYLHPYLELYIAQILIQTVLYCVLHGLPVSLLQLLMNSESF
jgi:hypothetical protein